MHRSQIPALFVMVMYQVCVVLIITFYVKCIVWEISQLLKCELICASMSFKMLELHIPMH